MHADAELMATALSPRPLAAPGGTRYQQLDESLQRKDESLQRKDTNLQRQKNESPQRTEKWIERYLQIRRRTEALCAPLCSEDCNLQVAATASPPKWHLAHTTWFFEYLFLLEFCAEYRELNPVFAQLFNSYYQAMGRPFPRSQRGALSRPTLDEVMTYRSCVDARVIEFVQQLESRPNGALKKDATQRKRQIWQRLALGLHHEQQHQELLLTDIKLNFSVNPLLPTYIAAPEAAMRSVTAAQKEIEWCHFEGGIRSLGGGGVESDEREWKFEQFHFDNEAPAHEVLLRPFALATRLIRNEEYLAFIEDGGYRRPELWLDEAWAQINSADWQAPLYWQRDAQQRSIYTLHGLVPLPLQAPVHHVSYYEADAFARWAGARLPTEAEWEHAASHHHIRGNFADDGVFWPLPPREGCTTELRQLFGDVWEWTASSYAPYPGFRAGAGAVAEYNGKFMCSQMVLRGGSCATPREHMRATYRNFLYPADRWQFSGIRLAR